MKENQLVGKVTVEINFLVVDMRELILHIEPEKIAIHREKTLEMHFPYAEMLLVCGHIVSK